MSSSFSSNHDSVAAGGDTSTPPVTEQSVLLEKMEGDVKLMSGERIHVRPIRPGDTVRLQAFHTHLSSDSITFRFFRYMPQLSNADAERFTHVDYDNRMALVATEGQGEAERILAVVRYDRIGPDTAEVAFVVEDRWQGHGVATALLHRLAIYARQHGITHLLAITLGSNAKMLDVLRNAGYPLSASYVNGEIEATLDITAPVATEPVL